MSDGFGGACETKATFRSSKITLLPNGTGEKLFEAITEDRTMQPVEYALIVSVLPKELNKKRVAIGENGCNSGLGLLRKDGSGQADESDHVMATLRMVPAESVDVSTLKGITEWMETDTYKAGRDSMLSFKDK